MCVQQDICCIRGAEGGRILSPEKRRQSGWKGHTHHSQTRPDVAPPSLGAQRWGPLHWRERKTCAGHTKVTHGMTCIISDKQHLMLCMRTEAGSSGTLTFPTLSTLFTNCLHWLFYFYYRYHIPLASRSHSPLLSWLVLLLCVPWHVSRDGAAGSVTDDDNRK